MCQISLKNIQKINAVIPKIKEVILEGTPSLSMDFCEVSFLNGMHRNLKILSID
jgi:hypothetical protein